MKKVFRVLFSLLLVFSVFGVINVIAAENIFTITGISVKEKSNGVTVNDVSLSEGVIVNNIIFTNEDDYIKYDITIKNNSDEDYIIKSISDNNESNYLNYTYDDLSNVKLNSSEEKTFNLTITYIEESSNNVITNDGVSLTVTYEKEDGTTGTEVIGGDNNTISNNISNPKTGDNIYLYIILGLISVGGLVITTVSSKKFAKGMMVIALASSLIIPFGVNAETSSFEIIFDNTIKDADLNVIFNANGGKFSDNSTKMSIPYSNREVVKISHSENVDDTGKKLSDYEENWIFKNIVGSDRGDSSLPHVVTIPGATSLTVDIYYGGENDGYEVVVINEAVTDFYNYSWNDGAYHDYCSEENGTFTINGNSVSNVGHEEFTVNGNTVTFGFATYSNEGYGYYAVVKGNVQEPINTIEEPTKEGYEFKGWYTDPECSSQNKVNLSEITSNTTLYAKFAEPSPYELVSGDFNTVGSIVNIKNEEFYVIGMQDSNHVKLLAKYNLNVGDNARGTATGIQDSQLNMNRKEGFVLYSTVDYATSFHDTYGNSKQFNEVILEDDEYYLYTDSYGSGTNIYQYVESYVDYLKDNGVNVTGRILTKDEFVGFDCNYSYYYNTISCPSSTPSWLLSTNYYYDVFIKNIEYFTRTPVTTFKINYVGDNEPKNGKVEDANAGVRPVIILELN